MEGEGKGMGGWYIINQRQMATVCGERCEGCRDKIKIKKKDDPDLHDGGKSTFLCALRVSSSHRTSGNVWRRCLIWRKGALLCPECGDPGMQLNNCGAQDAAPPPTHNKELVSPSVTTAC